MKLQGLVFFLLLSFLPLYGYSSPAIPELPLLPEINNDGEEETIPALPVIEPAAIEQQTETEAPAGATPPAGEIIPVETPGEETIKPIELPEAEELGIPLAIPLPTEARTVIPEPPVPDIPADATSNSGIGATPGDNTTIELPQVIEPEELPEAIPTITEHAPIPTQPDNPQGNTTLPVPEAPFPQVEPEASPDAGVMQPVTENNSVENIGTGETLEEPPSEMDNLFGLFSDTPDTPSPIQGDNAPEPWQGSVMFNDTEIKLLNDAIHSFERGDAFVTPTINKNTGEPVMPTVVTSIDVPTFFLNSIMYFSRENWSVWLNGKKLTKLSTENTPQIIDITEKFVKFRWVTRSLERFSPEWRNALTVKERSVFYSADRRVSFDETTGEVDFTLRPNQSFSLDTMAISEGKPIAATNTPTANQPFSPMQSPPAPNPHPLPGDDPLNQLYQKELERINRLKQLPGALQ